MSADVSIGSVRRADGSVAGDDKQNMQNMRFTSPVQYIQHTNTVKALC